MTVAEIEVEFEEYMEKHIPDSFPSFNWSVCEADGIILDVDSLPNDMGTIAQIILEGHISDFNFKTRHKRNGAGNGTTKT